jgi:predicted  nucleic acid-binding Zn-ribbon protein
MRELRSLADLLDLQAVDSDIDRLLHRRQSMPQLEQYRAAHEAAEGLAAQLASLEEELRTAERDLDKAEGELQLLEQKLEQEERRLYAGGMNARETANMQAEVVSLQTRRGGMEDGVLEMLDRREQMLGRTEAVRQEVTKARAVEAELEVAIAGEWKVIDAEIAVKEERKAEILPLIPQGLLGLYDRLRGREDGVAVARLDDGVCGGCHLRLSPAELNEALAEDPPRCIHCRRILVP